MFPDQKFRQSLKQFDDDSRRNVRRFVMIKIIEVLQITEDE